MMGRGTKGLLTVAAITLAVALVLPSAYALTSSVTNNSNAVASEYLTLDFLEISGTGDSSTASNLTFNDKDWSAASSTPGAFQLIPKGGGYSISIESNKDTGESPGAYLYGYFTITHGTDDANSGAGIESLTLKFNNYGNITLYRDAPKNQYELTNSISDSNPLNQWLLPIKDYEVRCYDIYAGTDGVTVNDGENVSNAQTVSDLLLASGLTIHLIVSWTSLFSA